MADEIHNGPRLLPLRELPLGGQVPERGTAAIIHLLRLAASNPRYGGRSLWPGLREVARRLNAELPPDQRVPLDDLRGSTPYDGFDQKAIGEASMAAIGAYVTPPENQKVIRRRQQGLISLERYFSWCRGMWLAGVRLDDLRRADGYEHDIEKESAYEDRGEHILGCMLHWLASLDVVIEGWEELELSDATVGQILTRGGDVKMAGTFRHRLRRLRNGIFHYQREGGDDPRFRDFFNSETAAGEWAVSLERALGAFFKKTFDLQHENVFGWLYRTLPENQWER